MKFNLIKSKILTGALALAMTVAMVPSMAMAEDVDAQAEEAAKLEAESMQTKAEVAAPASREAAREDVWSTVTVNGVTVSVSTTVEHLTIEADGNQCYIDSTIPGYFPKSFSIKISPSELVTALGGKFQYYNKPYGVVTTGTGGCSLEVNMFTPNRFSIWCPPANGGGIVGAGLEAYLPAYGQFANEGITEGGWGDGYTTSTVGKKAMVNAHADTGISLGSFGGYAVFKFDNPIPNSNKNKYGVDFVVYGNAFVGNSEPGGIQVSRDGMDWYDIAGSRHYKEDTVWDCEATYKNPHPEDNVIGAVAPVVGKYMGNQTVNYELRETARPGAKVQGKSVVVTHNPWHQHSWFPLAANYFNIRKIGETTLANDTAYDFVKYYSGVHDELKLKGVKTPFYNTSTGGNDHTFGYCDVHPNGSNYGIATNPYMAVPSTQGGDGIDISWAVNHDGSPANLSDVQYVRVYTGVATMNPTAVFGEVSTEVTGVYSVAQQADVVGVTDAPVVKNYNASVSHTNGGFTTVQTKTNGQIKLKITSPADSVYINGDKVSAAGGYNLNMTLAQNEEKYIQIIAQTADKEPYITVLKVVRP